jgi:hypothetical protein
MTHCIRLLLLFLSGLALHADTIRTVRDFGAAGDGQQDDTLAIEKAIAAGGTLSFPAGRYRLTRTLRIELEKVGPVMLTGQGATLEMAGAGPAVHLVGTVHRTAAPADFPPEFWAKQAGVSVSGLDFVGLHAEAVGLQVTRTMQLTVSRCNFRQLMHGIHFTERNRNAIIADCHIYDNRGAGVFVDRVDFHQLNIGNCHISYNHGGGIVVRGGALRNLQIGTCDIEANVAAGKMPTANILLDSSGGSIGEVEITGCTLQHYPGFPGFANIRYIGHSTAVPFTKEQRHGNLIITGNMINDADINIHLDGARGAVISGNSIHLAASHDVLIENSSEVILTDTLFDRHPRYNPDRKTGGGPMRQGIVIRNSNRCTLSTLRINGGIAAAAIEISGGEYFNISNCTITEVAAAALLLEGVSESVISGNILAPAERENLALRVRGGSGNLISGNLVRGRSEIEASTEQRP